jgi:hypothetical protein
VTWDAYCRMASPLAASVPWMVTLGNHEENDQANFIYAISSTYRFAGMPTGGRSDAGTGLRYYSWEAGPVHYISVDSFCALRAPRCNQGTTEGLLQRPPAAPAAA